MDPAGTLDRHLKLYDLSKKLHSPKARPAKNYGNCLAYFRGIGALKLLKNKNSGHIRILVRAEKTHKIVVNHLLQKRELLCNLEPMKTSKNAWTWAGYDISDEEPAFEKFCAKFTSEEDSEKFKTAFEKACKDNEAVLGKKAEEKKEEAPKEEAPKEEKAEDKKEEPAKTE